MTEIEIKAHVDDPVRTEADIARIARFAGETVKCDTYWRREAAENGSAGLSVKVRLRDENGTVRVTYKRKEMQGDIEVNDEQEFTIDERAPFEILLADLGLAPFIRKEKKTRSWDYRSPEGIAVTIELSLVAGLGWFAELEILAEDPDPARIERARGILRRTLALCGIPDTAIEARYYTDMLRELSPAVE